MGEKIKILCGRRNTTIGELANKIGVSRQNLSNKFARNNFSEKELIKIGDALDADFIGGFKLRDTQEKI